MQVDYTIPEPPHRQVAAQIRERIAAGEWAPGHAIPSEKAISDETGVARTTARRAIAVLREEGTVYTVRGRGSYVAER